MPEFALRVPGAKIAEAYDRSIVSEVDARVEPLGRGGWDSDALGFPADTSLERSTEAFDNVGFMLRVVGLD